MKDSLQLHPNASSVPQGFVSSLIILLQFIIVPNCRSKLWRMMADGNLAKNWKKIMAGRGPEDLPSKPEGSESGHIAAKFLRLSFHDCLKYKDGSGGCDVRLIL